MRRRGNKAPPAPRGVAAREGGGPVLTRSLSPTTGAGWPRSAVGGEKRPFQPACAPPLSAQRVTAAGATEDPRAARRARPPGGTRPRLDQAPAGAPSPPSKQPLPSRPPRRSTWPSRPSGRHPGRGGGARVAPTTSAQPTGGGPPPHPMWEARCVAVHAPTVTAAGRHRRVRPGAGRGPAGVKEPPGLVIYSGVTVGAAAPELSALSGNRKRGSGRVRGSRVKRGKKGGGTAKGEACGGVAQSAAVQCAKTDVNEGAPSPKT